MSNPPRIGPGAVLAGRYEVRRLIGVGGMGEVFEVYDRSLEMAGAVKVIKPAALDADTRARFRSEVRLARKVRHPHVCALHDFGADPDLDLEYISMELVEGQDLRQVLHESGPLAWDRAFEVALQVCDGLEAIHAAGIIHRDLKPANLMLEPGGHVKIMDFGVARAGAASTHTQANMAVGTPEYMSPEQIRAADLDFRSDVYALGVVIFELFTGGVPFRGDSPVGTMLKHLEEPPPLSSPRLPAPLVGVLARALAKSAADRFASVREMREALLEARKAHGDTDPVPMPSDGGLDSGARRTEIGHARPSLRPEATLPKEAALLLPMLVRALESPLSEIRLGAARAIALHGPSASGSAPALRALVRDPVKEVAETAALALRRVTEEPTALIAPPAPDDQGPTTSSPDRRPEVRAGPLAEASRHAPTAPEIETPVQAPSPPPPAALPAEAAPALGPNLRAWGRPAPSPVRRPPPKTVSRRWLAGLAGTLLLGLIVWAFRPWLPGGEPPPPLSAPPSPSPSTLATAVDDPSPLPPSGPPSTRPRAAEGNPAMPATLPAARTTSTPSTTVPTTTTTTVATTTTTTTTTPPTPTTLPAPPATTLAPVPARTTKPGDLVRSDDAAADLPACDKCPPVPFPQIARDPRVQAEGRIELRVLVDERGIPTIVGAAYRPLAARRPATSAGQKILKDAATAGVRKWRYLPARKDGVAVRMEVGVLVDFRLD